MTDNEHATNDTANQTNPASAPPQTLTWSNSPGVMAPGDQVNWDGTLGLWGPQNPLLPAKTWGPVHVFYAFLFLILAQVVVSVIAIGAVLAQSGPDVDPAAIDADLTGLTTNGPFLILGLVSLWAVFGGYPLWVTWFRGAKSFAKDFGFKFNWKFDIVAGICLAAALRLAEAVLTLGASAVGIDLTSADNSSFLNDPTRAIIWTVLLALGAGLGAPFFEELFFRGFALRALMRRSWESNRKIGNVRISAIRAVIVSSILFGVMHTTALNSGGLFLVILTGLLGSSFAVITLRQGRLGTAMLGHAFFNSSAVLAVMFASTQVYLLPVMAVVFLISGGVLLYWRKQAAQVATA